MKRTILLAIILLAACGPAPEPPQVNTAVLDRQVYLPLACNDCREPIPGKGLAYTWPERYPNDYRPLGISWYYNWGSMPARGVNAEYVRMAWCYISQIDIAADRLGGEDHTEYFMYQNEPNRSACGDTPHESAVKFIYAKELLPNAKFIVLNLAHVGSREPYDPVQYADQWREEVKTLTGSYPEVAGYGIHFYLDKYQDVVNYVNSFVAWMQEAGELDKELWVTEFGACPGWETYDRLDEVLEFVGGHPQIDRYAYWTNRRQDVVPYPGPTPTPTTWAGTCSTSLYDENTFTLSHQGRVYRDYAGPVQAEMVPEPYP